MQFKPEKFRNQYPLDEAEFSDQTRRFVENSGKMHKNLQKYALFGRVLQAPLRELPNIEQFTDSDVEYRTPKQVCKRQKQKDMHNAAGEKE